MERKIHSRFYSPLRLYSSFYSGVRSALCCQAERKGEQRRTRLRLQARPSTIYVLTLDLSFLFQFLAAFLKVAWRHFHSARCHVGRSGVGLFERGGPNQPLPAPPGVQGWRHRCLMLAATANLEPGWPRGGGHLLRMDSHTLGSPFWKGDAARPIVVSFEGTVCWVAPSY